MAGLTTAIRTAHEAMRRSDMPAALNAAKIATATHPTSAEGWWLRGTAACALDQMADAEAAFQKAADCAPRNSATRAQMLALRGKPLVSEGRMAEAIACAKDAVAIGLNDVPSLVRVSYTFTHGGLHDDALACALKATGIDPNHAESWYNLGSAWRTLGDIAQAEAAFNKAIALSPTPPIAAYYNLANLRRWTAGDNHIAILEGLACHSSLEACRVAYTLYKEYDDIGQLDAAWDCLTVGAELGRKIEAWSAEEEAETVAAWRKHLPAEAFSAQPDTRPRSGPKRIFIVGLPRSGTTLVERILAAHSQVQALGELKTFGIVTHRLANVPGARRLAPGVIEAAVALDPLTIAEAYTRETAFLHDGSPYVIDKLPSNHEYAGLIKRAFPDATIIALDRNPMDALFGCYKVLFTGAYGWSYAQDDLAEHYRHFRDLMAHWQDVLGDGLVRISLEGLIQDPESEIRRLVAACGLPFEEGCLKPHEAKGGVSTASAVQVRNPINGQGVGAWKKYEAQLAPLHARLRELGFVT
ncbi:MULTISPECIES: sulfotransferase [Asticcacaulis]|uniref:tetratricopeptide repeat-containing sulfotransferase family protein n=1 Tax=Asticcacaulis TaxID=76890 RepID=UPI001AE765F3|nr:MULTISPECIES: sulfotransferase [Asticcacaulis]MBP2157915.1 tetratricopeptide (TPR) repeat protein [Asticcacaulis solisilvae]MDR6798960.1 tetratricopeptide (TPR) repeat protein [Asticcacaulis sp. BE141]